VRINHAAAHSQALTPSPASRPLEWLTVFTGCAFLPTAHFLPAAARKARTLRHSRQGIRKICDMDQMDQAEQKRKAVLFLENLNNPDPAVFRELTTEDFRFEIVSGLKEFPPIRGRENFAITETATLRKYFPNGLNLKIKQVICEGPHVAVIAEADTIVSTGKRYHQRYNFYLRFEGGLIAEGFEYNDTNLIRECFLA
jgi:ketosteroid isomerase-like protein